MGTTAATPMDVAQAMAPDNSILAGASTLTQPPTQPTFDVRGSALGGFPTQGSGFGIMSTGDPALADDPNDSEGSGTDMGGQNFRGDTDLDVTVMKIDLEVPADKNCLSLDFRFLSEEYDEFVGSSFNDTFIAELDVSDWSTSGSTISAPNNFAFDQNGQVISINSAGYTSMSFAAAKGTTYDGATPRLKAMTTIDPGAHSLYLSIFDQGDAIYDSAVFLDNLLLSTMPEGECNSGTQPPPDSELCIGLVRGDVDGKEPSYSGKSLASFPNDDTACTGMWAPNLDGYFVPQGIAPAANRVWVSGYYSDEESPPCAVYSMDKTTGKRKIGYVFKDDDVSSAAKNSGFPKLKCTHGSGVSLLSNGMLLVADTKDIWVVDPGRFGTKKNPVRRVIAVKGATKKKKFTASFLVDDPDPAYLWIGTWSEGPSAVRRFALSQIIDADNVINRLDASQTFTQLPKKAQGGAFTPSGKMMVSSSRAYCSHLSLINELGTTVANYGFAPGAEEIAFIDGRLWGTFEAGTRAYPKSFFPLIASFNTTGLNALPNCDL